MFATGLSIIGLAVIGAAPAPVPHPDPAPGAASAVVLPACPYTRAVPAGWWITEWQDGRVVCAGPNRAAYHLRYGRR